MRLWLPFTMMLRMPWPKAMLLLMIRLSCWGCTISTIMAAMCGRTDRNWTTRTGTINQEMAIAHFWGLNQWNGTLWSVRTFRETWVVNCVRSKVSLNKFIKRIQQQKSLFFIFNKAIPYGVYCGRLKHWHRISKTDLRKRTETSSKDSNRRHNYRPLHEPTRLEAIKNWGFKNSQGLTGKNKISKISMILFVSTSPILLRDFLGSWIDFTDFG